MAEVVFNEIQRDVPTKFNKVDEDLKIFWHISNESIEWIRSDSIYCVTALRLRFILKKYGKHNHIKGNI